MNDKLFLIAVGGTGMRCLESFVYLCAAGMFDEKEIEILTIDTDQNNGNKGRVESLIRLYNDVKSNDNNTLGGNPYKDTFFSAKLNLYSFYTNYSKPERRTLKSLAQQFSATDLNTREENQELLDLMFDNDSVQEFDLEHGYRAQTHLGSMLMYHGIIEAARNIRKGGKESEPEKELHKFLDKLNDFVTGARIFIFGSVFGGTGASSIPVLPLAIKAALNIVAKNTVLDFKTVKFGTTLLTDYFTFKIPTEDEIRVEKVIADSNIFSLNSQAALEFYNNDPSVQEAYRMLYHIGWPSTMKINYSEGRENKIVTGGKEQENSAHIAELLSACAAYDFFNREYLPEDKSSYVFRTVEADDNNEGVKLLLTGRSFVGPDGDKFEKKLGAFLSFAYLVLTTYGASKQNEAGTLKLIEALNQFGSKDERLKILKEYAQMPPEKAKEIDKFMREFAFKINDVKNEIEKGWIYQINDSVKGSSFLFRPETFKTNVREIFNIDYGVILTDKTHHWVNSGNGGFLGLGGSNQSRNNSFQELIKKLRTQESKPREGQGNTLKEKFLAHMYNAIAMAQHYKIELNH